MAEDGRRYAAPPEIRMRGHAEDAQPVPFNHTQANTGGTAVQLNQRKRRTRPDMGQDMAANAGGSVIKLVDGPVSGEPDAEE